MPGVKGPRCPAGPCQVGAKAGEITALQLGRSEPWPGHPSQPHWLLHRSLCLVDEFGKGTLPHDGLGLFCATLGHFVQSPNPPRVLACTHFSETLRFEQLTRQGAAVFWFGSVEVIASNLEHESIPYHHWTCDSLCVCLDSTRAACLPVTDAWFMVHPY